MAPMPSAAQITTCFRSLRHHRSEYRQKLRGLLRSRSKSWSRAPSRTPSMARPACRPCVRRRFRDLSVVTVFFDPSGDIYRDRQVVAERLTVAAQQLPQGTAAPAMTPLTSSTSTALVIGLTSETRSLMELRTAADWTIRQRLLSVPGVAKVVVFGGDLRSIQVQVHPTALIQYNLGLNDVLNAARRATGVRGAGFIDTRNQRLVFQSEGQSPHRRRHRAHGSGEPRSRQHHA